MAVIGHAEVIVTPITRGFEAALRRDLAGIRGTLGAQGRRTGQSFAEALQDGMSRSFSNNVFGKFSDGLRNMVPEAEMARERFQTLVRVGYVLQGVLGPLVGAVGSLAVSLGTLVGVLAKAAPAVAVLANGFVLLRTAMATAKFGFGDIASAVQQATQPTTALGKSIEEVREEFQQLQFDAEQAALSEGRAALNLEKALENLRRTADLPPNSAARREAQLAYEEAELAYRRAKDRTQDLNAEVAKGPEALNKAAAGNDPFANLNEAQREFAERLVELKPLIDDLELSVSRAFLPPLERAVDILVRDLLPILERRLPTVGRQVGESLEGIAEGLDQDKIDRILEGFTKPFDGTNRSNIELFGDLLDNVLDIFLTIVEATGPLLSELLVFLVGKTEDWQTALAGTDLQRFFQEAGDVAGQLGEILGNVLEGLGNLGELTTGPGSAGQMMLDWMKESTDTFANMFSEDPEAGKKFFADAFVNARSVMSFLGALIQEILGLADNPNIAKTFETLKESTPAIGEMLGKMIDAGPSFAELVKTITEIANKLTDDNQIGAFFDTLNSGAQRFNDFLDTDAAKNLLDNLGPIFARLSAFGVLFDIIRFGGQVLIGYLAFLGANLGKFFTPITDFFKNVRGGGGIFASLGKFLKGPLVLGAIAFVIGKVFEFYDSFEDFKEMIDGTLGNIKGAFDRLMEPVSELFSKIFGGEDGGGLLSAFDPVLKIILEFLIPAIGYVIERLLSTLTLVFEIANNIIDFVMPIISNVADAIGKLFEGDIAGFFEGILRAIAMLVPGIVQFVFNTIIDMINWVIRKINSFVDNIANTPFGSFLKDVMGLDLGQFELGELQKVDWTGDMQRYFDRQDARENAATNGLGSDRRFTQSSLTSNLDSYARSSIQQQSGWQDYMNPGLTINQTNNIQSKDINESVAMADRLLASGVRKGMG